MIIFFNRKEGEIIHTRAKILFSFLIKNYISNDHDLFVVWIVQFVYFGIVVITDEDELLTFVIKLASSLVWYIHVGNASKNSQMGDVGLSFTLCWL